LIELSQNGLMFLVNRWWYWRSRKWQAIVKICCVKVKNMTFWRLFFINT